MNQIEIRLRVNIKIIVIPRIGIERSMLLEVNRAKQANEFEYFRAVMVKKGTQIIYQQKRNLDYTEAKPLQREELVTIIDEINN